jgi:hypothetical protein
LTLITKELIRTITLTRRQGTSRNVECSSRTVRFVGTFDASAIRSFVSSCAELTTRIWQEIAWALVALFAEIVWATVTNASFYCISCYVRGAA